MDKTGNPVTDLKPIDFIVYDNKKPQNITEFEQHILFPGAGEIESAKNNKKVCGYLRVRYWVSEFKDSAGLAFEKTSEVRD